MVYDKVGLFYDKVGFVYDKVGLVYEKVGLFYDKVGLVYDKVGFAWYKHKVPGNEMKSNWHCKQSQTNLWLYCNPKPWTHATISWLSSCFNLKLV